MKPKEIWYAEAAVAMLYATARAINNDFGALPILARENLVEELEAAADTLENAVREAKEAMPVAG